MPRPRESGSWPILTYDSRCTQNVDIFLEWGTYKPDIYSREYGISSLKIAFTTCKSIFHLFSALVMRLFKHSKQNQFWSEKCRALWIQRRNFPSLVVYLLSSSVKTLVELSVTRIIWHGHPYGYSCKCSEGVDICTNIRALWQFTWTSVRMSVSNYPCYRQFD